MPNSFIPPAIASSTADARRNAENTFYADEDTAMATLIKEFPLSSDARRAITADACDIVSASRAMKDEQGTLDAFLAEFGLSNQEGVALMCLAEALLRVPDADTQDNLIAEKILAGDWASHKGKSDNLFVNASTWALMLTGNVVDLDDEITSKPKSWLAKIVNRSGEPVIRAAVNQAMKIMGRQFVFGRTMDEALKRQKKEPAYQRVMSFDMLGEGARTMETAERYFQLYKQSILAVGKASGNGGKDLHERSSVSIKLSALHPRYDALNKDRVLAELLPRLVELAELAKSADIQLTIDAEECDRLDLQLDIVAALANSAALKGWNGLGIAVQAYQKRAPHVIDFLINLAKETDRTLAVRLVKGAYWDTEIKSAQMQGYSDYPVWTRKTGTDICYLYCAARMLSAPGLLYPQFATHNAHTIAAICYMAGDQRFEFQRLHGMGSLLYKAVRQKYGTPIQVRTYAPVGEHEDLLPYLVRRLLENGANSSFVNRFMDAAVPVEQVASDPLDEIAALASLRHGKIPKPLDIYGPTRAGAKGLNLMCVSHSMPLTDHLAKTAEKEYRAHSLIAGMEAGSKLLTITNPADRRRVVGTAVEASPQECANAISAAKAAWRAWDKRGGAERATLLRRVADLMEEQTYNLIDLLVREAGKTLGDCVSEVREAVDFCRYYAAEAEAKFTAAAILPGPTGEDNSLALGGRGVFVCISPWNFPLAIFTGQIAAALAAGNTVVAKPADQTPLIAHAAVKLFYQAGIPADALNLLLGSGAVVGNALIGSEDIAGVAFTGSTATAKHINRTLAAREGAIIPFIAETGGQNVMIVDSTALPEQVADDVLLSAFGSAGQRCSALRVLCLQDDVAGKMLDMISLALDERAIGDPAALNTDIGPIIDEPARDKLAQYCRMRIEKGQLVKMAELPDACSHGSFLAPHIFEITNIGEIDGEKFGPILHIIRYKPSELPALIESINKTGFGLTFGIHSRLEHRWDALYEATLNGNTYINRNMIGAVVGVQPFGGEGLSGTGPKAGGPHYLLRFAAERTLTVNTAAVGGNAALFSLED